MEFSLGTKPSSEALSDGAKRHHLMASQTSLEQLMRRRKEHILAAQAAARRLQIDESRRAKTTEELKESEVTECAMAECFPFVEKKRQSKSRHNRSSKARILQVHDFMLGQDLEMLNDEDFLVCARPAGDRHVVISGKGATSAWNSQGFIKREGFQSLLPGGNRAKAEFSRCVLDCVYDEANNTFHVLDMIEWEGMSYKDLPFASRLHVLQQKLPTGPSLDCSFRVVDYRQCTPSNLVELALGPVLARHANGLGMIDTEAMLRDPDTKTVYQ